MRPAQVAVVDLGSNSWRVVIFAREGSRWWTRTDELYETVRIGAGLGSSGLLGHAAIERGIETLAVFERFCGSHGIAPAKVITVATSAIRDASNQAEFLRRARAATALQIEVLSAADEARYGYVAAVNTTTISDGLVLELGGGSLQLVGVHERQATTCASLPLGAVRVTEQFLSGSGPPKKKELARAREHLRGQLAELELVSSGGRRLVGLGGAVRNLAAAAQHEEGLSDVGVQGYVLGTQAIATLTSRLASMTVAQRGSLRGIKPGRGDIILAAALTLEAVLELGGFDGVEVTEAGLREGLFFARSLLRGTEPLLPDVRRAAVLNLAHRGEPDMTHAEHVASLALQMHESLVTTGLFEPAVEESELLWAASMLHDIGMSVSYDDHHKHSSYLIASAELPGFDPRERALVSQIARYHRKGTPKLPEMGPLWRDGDQALLERCAVILRLAEHLERGRDQAVREARLRTNGDGVDLHLDAAGDLTLPRWSVERYGDGEAFERVFGRRLLVD